MSLEFQTFFASLDLHAERYAYYKIFRDQKVLPSTELREEELHRWGIKLAHITKIIREWCLRQHNEIYIAKNQEMYPQICLQIPLTMTSTPITHYGFTTSVCWARFGDEKAVALLPGLKLNPDRKAMDQAFKQLCDLPNHPNVGRSFAYSIDNDPPFARTCLLVQRGKCNLAEWLKEEKRSWQQLLMVAQSVCEGLLFLKSRDPPIVPWRLPLTHILLRDKKELNSSSVFLQMGYDLVPGSSTLLTRPYQHELTRGTSSWQVGVLLYTLQNREELDANMQEFYTNVVSVPEGGKLGNKLCPARYFELMVECLGQKPLDLKDIVARLRVIVESERMKS